MGEDGPEDDPEDDAQVPPGEEAGRRDAGHVGGPRSGLGWCLDPIFGLCIAGFALWLHRLVHLVPRIPGLDDLSLFRRSLPLNSLTRVDGEATQLGGETIQKIHTRTHMQHISTAAPLSCAHAGGFDARLPGNFDALAGSPNSMAGFDLLSTHTAEQ